MVLCLKEQVAPLPQDIKLHSFSCICIIHCGSSSQLHILKFCFCLFVINFQPVSIFKVFKNSDILYDCAMTKCNDIWLVQSSGPSMELFYLFWEGVTPGGPLFIENICIHCSGDLNRWRKQNKAPTAVADEAFPSWKKNTCIYVLYQIYMCSTLATQGNGSS